jgi:SAM-dependent methyltransferase
MSSADPYARNLAVYRDESVVRAYSRDSWICPAEAQLTRQLASEVRGEPVLDLGVGGGRTISLLSLVTDHYTGLDYSPEMVDLARTRHPYADVRVGDARDLSAFDDGSLGAVVFSFNGIDSISHNDRAQVFAEIHRVLRPGGLLLYSTLNKDSPKFPARPWRQFSSATRAEWRAAVWRRKLLLVLQLVNAVLRRLQAVPNWWHVRGLEQDHGSWATGLLAVHDYRLLSHLITVEAAAAELPEAGFAAVSILDPKGTELDRHAPMREDDTIVILARRD